MQIIVTSESHSPCCFLEVGIAEENYSEPMVASLTTYYISTLLDALSMVPSLSMVHFQLA